MDRFPKAGKNGQPLLTQLVELSGLPKQEANAEVEAILSYSGIKKEETTLEDLRTAMLAYLEELDEQMRSEPSHSVQ